MSYYFEDRPVAALRAPRGSYQPHPIFLGITAILVLFSVLAWMGVGSDGLNVFVMVLAGWLFSLCVHEFAHAFVAFKAGDISVPGRGYLTLNPLKYVNWVLSILFPILFMIAGGIALPGGSVLIDHQYVRSRAKQTAISLAGPAVNLVFAVALTLPFTFGVDPAAHQTFWSGAAYLAYFQFMAGIFNLLPIPGLDGGNAIYPWLSESWKRGFNVVRPWGFFVVILLLWQTSLGQSLVNHIASGMVSSGVDWWTLYHGQGLFQFWQH